MKPSDIRNHISQQCGFNKAKLAYYDESTDSSNYANPLYIVTYPDGHTLSTMEERVAQKEVIKFNSKQGEKTQPQRLLESIIPNKAVQVCNAGDWPDIESQQRYWQERDEHLDKIESNALWFDNKAKNERHPFA